MKALLLVSLLALAACAGKHEPPPQPAPADDAPSGPMNVDRFPGTNDLISPPARIYP